MLAFKFPECQSLLSSPHLVAAAADVVVVAVVVACCPLHAAVVACALAVFVAAVQAAHASCKDAA